MTKKPNYIEWRKPRFNRSRVKVVKYNLSKATQSIGTFYPNLNTNWKKPISRDTFDELKDKGALSKTQIDQYQKNYGSKNKYKKSDVLTEKEIEQLIFDMKNHNKKK